MHVYVSVWNNVSAEYCQCHLNTVSFVNAIVLQYVLRHCKKKFS